MYDEGRLHRMGRHHKVATACVKRPGLVADGHRCRGSLSHDSSDFSSLHDHAAACSLPDPDGAGAHRRSLQPTMRARAIAANPVAASATHASHDPLELFAMPDSSSAFVTPSSFLRRPASSNPLGFLREASRARLHVEHELVRRGLFFGGARVRRRLVEARLRLAPAPPRRARPPSTSDRSTGSLHLADRRGDGRRRERRRQQRRRRRA